MGFDPMTIARPASDESFRNLLARLDSLEGALAERSAMISQITVTRGEQRVEPWTPPASTFADVAVMTMAVPEWATSVVVSGAGHIQPRFNTSAGSPYVYGRLRVSAATNIGPMTRYSEPFFSWMAASNVPAGLSWPFYFTSLASSTIEIATQAYSSVGAVVEGGSVSVAAVAEWIR